MKQHEFILSLYLSLETYNKVNNETVVLFEEAGRERSNEQKE